LVQPNTHHREASMPTPATIRRNIPFALKERRYYFHLLKHGDAIEVESVGGAREMFRRWKNANGTRARLIASRDNPQLLFFIDERDPV
jgi:hypothetical protein